MRAARLPYLGALLALPLACGGAGIRSGSGAPSAPPAPRSSTHAAPATTIADRFEDRFVLVRDGAPLRSAPSDDAPVVRERKNGPVVLGGSAPFRLVRVHERFIEVETVADDHKDVHCIAPQTAFDGLAL